MLEGPETELIVLGILGAIVLGATFAAVDAGLYSIGEVRLRALRDAGGPYAAAADRALRERGAIQSRLLAGKVLGIAIAASLSAYLAWSLDGTVAAIAAAAAVSFLYGVAEEIGTSIARQRAARGTLRTLRFLRPFELLFIPFAVPLGWLGRAISRIVPPSVEQNPERVAELEVEHFIEQGEESGTIPGEHASLLRSVLEFKNTVAHEVMVPRTHMVAFEIHTPLKEVLATIVAQGHSRYPVYTDRADHVEGILYAKDIFRVLLENESLDGVNLAQLMRKPVFYAAENQKIVTLLREMQSRRVHLAVVVDEFGGTSGIVTLEDILEEIVGEIQDEHDEVHVLVQETAPGHYLVDASISVYDLQDQLGERLVEREGDFDTLGGFIIEQAGKVPAPGESISAGAFDLVVQDADDRHVTRVEVVKRVVEAPNAAE